MGQPKHLLPFGQETMLQRVVRLLDGVVSPIVVVAAPNQQLPSLPDEVAIVHDEREHLGPLAGLLTGFNAIGPSVGAAYVSGCDVPLLEPAFVRRLVHCLGNYDLAIPREGEFYHPLAAVYRIRLRNTVQSLIEQGRMRPLFLVESSNSNVVDVEKLRDVDPQLDSLRNINAPDDYRSALMRAGLQVDSGSDLGALSS